MTVKELFSLTDTFTRRIIIRGRLHECDDPSYRFDTLYVKEPFTHVGRCDYLDYNVAWIAYITKDRIDLTVSSVKSDSFSSAIF